MPDWAAYARERLRLDDLRPERQAEIVEEIAGQLDQAYQEGLQKGLSEQEAEAAVAAHVADWDALSAALRESPIGRIPALDQLAERAAERNHARSGIPGFFASVWRDVLYGLRLLGKNRGFAAAAILTMAIGIGANTAVFSIIDSTLFFPLPYPNANRIVSLGVSPRGATVVGGVADNVLFEAWKQHNRSLAAICGDDGPFASEMTLTGVGEAERVLVAHVTSGFFQVFGVGPTLGRAFLPSETRPMSPGNSVQVAILSYGLWRDRFGADPKIIGQAIHLNDKLYTVVGVMPRNFVFPSQAAAKPALFVPFNLAPMPTRNGGTFQLVKVLGRLKPGVSAQQAQANLALIFQHLFQSRAAWMMAMPKGAPVSVLPLRDYLVGDTRTPLVIFWGAVGFLLLIACVNVANLALARALGREKEIAVRVALGAHRRRVARQLLTENVLLATLGGLVGIGIAYAIVVLARALGPADMPRLRQATINFPVLALTIALAALAGILAGLAPVRAAWKLSTVEALKEGARTNAGRSHRRLRSVLVVSEIALALVLAVGAGLLVRSLLRLTDVPLHFDPHNLLTAQIQLPTAKYATPEQQSELEKELLRRVRELPQVREAAVSCTDDGPTMGFCGQGTVFIEGRPGVTVGSMAIVGSGFFHTMGIRVLEGREFLPTDTASSQRVAIINEAFARQYFPHVDPLGRKLSTPTGMPNGWEATVVGVVGDFQGVASPQSQMFAAALYRPYAQSPAPDITLLLRAKGNPLAVVSGLRAQVQGLDPDLPLYHVATMDHVIGEQTATQRFQTVLLGGFALIALVLAALGVYGVISYAVSEQTHEIGIRMALGAKKSSVLRMIVGKTLILALIGIGIGIGGALALTRYLRSLLYQIRPDDPWSFAIAAVVLLVAALLAGFVPARRATKIDPLTALHYE